MHIFHTTSGFKKLNISTYTLWNCNFSLPFKNLPLKLHVIQTPLQKLGRNNLYYVLNISYFSHFTSNISGQQCMGLEAALTWKTCTFCSTKKLPCALLCTINCVTEKLLVFPVFETFIITPCRIYGKYDAKCCSVLPNDTCNLLTLMVT